MLHAILFIMTLSLTERTNLIKLTVFVVTYRFV